MTMHGTETFISTLMPAVEHLQEKRELMTNTYKVDRIKSVVPVLTLNHADQISDHNGIRSGIACENMWNLSAHIRLIKEDDQYHQCFIT